MANYNRTQYNSFKQHSANITEFQSSTDTPEKYGNEVYRQLVNMGYTKEQAKKKCIDNSNLIFNAFLMGESVCSTKLELAR